jgi:hypothetical protein
MYGPGRVGSDMLAKVGGAGVRAGRIQSLDSAHPGCAQSAGRVAEVGAEKRRGTEVSRDLGRRARSGSADRCRIRDALTANVGSSGRTRNGGRDAKLFGAWVPVAKGIGV